MTNGENAFLKKVFAVDALTCLASGVLMLGATNLLASLTVLPTGLLTAAGAALLPIAALFGVMSRMRTIPAPLLYAAVLGNAAWVVASIGVVLVAAPNALGAAFVLAQAAVVAVLATLEARGLRSSGNPSLV